MFDFHTLYCHRQLNVNLAHPVTETYITVNNADSARSINDVYGPKHEDCVTTSSENSLFAMLLYFVVGN